MHDSEQLDDLLQRAYRYALSLSHDADVAQDLVQDACLVIGRQGGPWRIEYFLPTIRNRYIDHYRRRQRVTFEPLEGVTLAVEETVRDVGTQRVLEAALATLRPTERELLYLSAVEEYTAAEIARLRGQPRGTVLSALHRAKQKLRLLLSGEAFRTLP